MNAAQKRTMLNLPHHVIADILSRLPVKSLVQLKGVCKSWRSLISDLHFVKLHFNRAISDANTNHSRLFTMFPFHSMDYESPSSFENVDDDDDAIVDLGYPLKDPGVGVGIVGSCNGLISLLYHPYPYSIILWNPSIRDSRELPKPPTSFSDAVFFYGLGYVTSIDEYKVVKGARSDSANSTRVEIFNLKDNSWRMIQGLHNSIIISEEVGIFVDGALHWQASCGIGPDKHNAIVSLDLGEEKFGELSQPDTDDRNILFHTLGVLGGCLSLLSFGNGHGRVTEVWVMKEYGIKASWTKLTVLRDTEFEYCEQLLPVCFTKSGELIVDIDGRKLVTYNLHEKTSRNLKNPSEDYLEWAIYVESLVSPHGGNGIDRQHEAQV